MLSKNTAYLPRLDHLRFFAALLVMCYHFHATMMIGVSTVNPILLLVKEGETGVSLFMILSGFILTRISFQKKIDYRAFMFNRFLRIYPLYLVMLFIAAFSGGRHIDPMSFIALLSPVGNLGNVVLPKFPHIWTIAVEFQFYLIFPFLVGFLSRYGTRYLLGLIAFAILVRGMMFLTDGSIQDGSYWTILGRIDQFLIGMLAAVAYAQRRNWMGSPVALIAGGIAVFGWFYVVKEWTGGYYGTDAATNPAWIISPSFEALIWAAFILVYLCQRWTMPRTLDRVLCYLGEISFSLYMWHYPIVRIFYKFYPAWNSSPVWGAYLFLIVIPVIVAVSALSYLVIERPFFSFRTVYIRAQNPATYAAAGVGNVVERVTDKLS